jgi:hypothetical protein
LRYFTGRLTRAVACFCLSREARAPTLSISLYSSPWRALTRSFSIEITSPRKLASSKESLLDADSLAGEHLAQIDLLAIEADTAAGCDAGSLCH